MSASPMVSMSSARAALDALLAKLNVGGTPGHIKIFTGSPPATVETADSGTLLSTLTLSATAFQSSTDPGSNGLATAVANPITSDINAAATGTAGYFRAYDSAGSCVVQGTCGTSSADMDLNTTSIAAGSTVAISAWTVTLPDGSAAD